MTQILSLPARFLQLVLLPLAIIASMHGSALALVKDEPTVLAPEAEQKQTLGSIYRALRLSHFRKMDINDEFSSRLFDEYFNRLDNNRLYFLASDLEEFQQHRFKLDDYLDSLDLTFAYEVYNRYQARSRQRIAFLLDELENAVKDYDFQEEQTLVTDRSEQAWAESTNELDSLWRKRLKIAVLNFKLSDKTVDEAVEILSKRYSNQLNRLNQTNNTDVFQTFADAITGLYGPHTQYFSPRKSENFDIDMRLSLEGIGAVLQMEYENTKITRLIPAGPAERSGQLHPSDLIVGVAQGTDGEMVDVVGWRLDEVVQLIRGPKGSTVRLQIIPAGAENKLTKEVVLVRNTVKLEEQAAQKHLIEIERQGQTHKLGLISIPTFYVDFDALRNGDPDYRSTTRDVERLMNELMAEGAEGLVIDLRNNGGGALIEAIDLAGLFIPQGPIVQIKDSWDQIQVKFDQNPKAYDIPLAVLVNRLSASASEIFAGAIQDYNRGIVLGSQTFGKGTVQVLAPLNAGQIKLTRAKFYRVNGASTQMEGVTPDISLPSIFDATKIGERYSDGALAWDAVKPLPHLTYPEFVDLLPELEQQHQLRVASEDDYAMIVDQVDYQRQRESENSIPLQEDKLRELRDEEEHWRLKMQNRLRLARNQSPLENLAELEEEEQISEQENNPQRDVLVRESSEILLDLIQLSQPVSPSLTFK